MSRLPTGSDTDIRRTRPTIPLSSTWWGSTTLRACAVPTGRRCLRCCLRFLWRPPRFTVNLRQRTDAYVALPASARFPGLSARIGLRLWLWNACSRRRRVCSRRTATFPAIGNRRVSSSWRVRSVLDSTAFLLRCLPAICPLRSSTGIPTILSR